MKVVLMVLALALAGCVMRPEGEQAERDRVAAAGVAFHKPFAERELPDLAQGATLSEFLAHAEQANGALEAALAEMDGLIKEQPQNGYFYEVKGDFLMRSGKMKEAIPFMRQALKLQPDSPLIRVQLAIALQQSADSDPAAVEESVGLLRKSLIDDQNAQAYRMLASAYYKQGKGPEADAMTAQAYFVEGNIKQSQIFAKRAQSKLHPGTPEWIKNDDIVNYRPEDLEQQQ